MIKLIKSTFYKETETKRKLANFVRSAEKLSFGRECLKFEKNFSKYQDRKYCVFFSSGSTANLSLIQALLNLNWLKKDEAVGFSALTWATNVMPIIQLGLKPIPVDIELNTLNASSKKLNDTSKKYPLKAFFITNLLGFCHDPDKIKELCDSKKIILLEDNCESLGTIYKKRRLGNFGLASTFSFFVGHHMSTIEGGAVCTDNEELAEMLRMVRAHGWDRHLQESQKKRLKEKHGISDFHAQYTFYNLAYNARPTEINGFLGNNQLKYIDEIVKKRNKNFLKLASKIYKRKEYLPIEYGHIDHVSNFAVPIICRSESIYKELLKKCKSKLEIRPIVGGNMLLQPFFKKNFPDYSKSFRCPNADLAHTRGFYFGNNPDLNDSDINKIAEIILK